jgi:putative acetyltransferase
VNAVISPPVRPIPPGFSIRPATNADIPAIRSVLHRVRQEYGVLAITGASDPDLDDLAVNYFARGGFFEVVEDAANQIVGCAGLYPLDESRAELCKMYIEKSGRGYGMGKRLLEDMLAAARRGGFTEVWLETNSILKEATTIYQQYGFRPIAAEHLLPKCDQAYSLRLE